MIGSRPLTPAALAQRALRDAQAAELRRLVIEERIPVLVAGRRMGLTEARTEKLRRRYKIRADERAVVDHRLRCIWRKAANDPQRSAKVGLTEAQQQNIQAAKRRMWRGKCSLPPVTDAEAERLVAEFLATRGATLCPPAAAVDVPMNAGARWR